MEKINWTFSILKVFGIVFVVSGHLSGGGGINLFYDWFPVYSFHLPLFAFITGYFYKKNNEMNFIAFFKKKIKKIIIPYFIWNLFYGIILSILIERGIVNFGMKLSWETFLIFPFTNGQQFAFNLSSWFAITYFLSIVVYTLTRKLLSYVKLNENFFIQYCFSF